MMSSEICGLVEWQRWSKQTATDAPKACGIYVLRLTQLPPLQRIKGISDILYIGGSGKGQGTLQTRLRRHCRAREDEEDLGFRLERVIKEVLTPIQGTLQVSWKVHNTRSEAFWHEGQLLKQYLEDHIECPPLNRQQSGKKAQQAFSLLVHLPADQRDQVLTRLSKRNALP